MGVISDGELPQATRAVSGRLLRIVEESYRGHRQGSATARRYGISRSLLSVWQREFRSGVLGASVTGSGFMPLVDDGSHPEPTEQPARKELDTRIDIVLTNGRRMTILVSLAPSRLAALVAVLDPR